MTDDIGAAGANDLDNLVTVTAEEVREGALLGLTEADLLAEKRVRLIRAAAGMPLAEYVALQRRYPAMTAAKLNAAAADSKLAPAALAALDSVTAANKGAGRGTTLSQWAEATGRDRNGQFLKK